MTLTGSWFGQPVGSPLAQLAALSMAQKYDNSVQYVDRIVSILLKKKLDKICAQDEVPVSRLAMASISLRLGASRQKARCGYTLLGAA